MENRFSRRWCDFTVGWTLFGWGSLLFIAGGAVAQSASIDRPVQTKSAVTDIPAGRTVEGLFEDFLHYARIGRFTQAEAFAATLLAHPELDPLVILEAAKKDKKCVDTLLIMINHSSLSASAAKVLELIENGERLRRQDLERIVANIELLAGDPQQEFFATMRLIESGEYAVPSLVQVLLDPGKSSLWPRVISALPKLGKSAVNPLVMALQVRNLNVRVNVIRALGEIGYPQEIPYLLKAMADEQSPVEVRDACNHAIARIEQITGRSFSRSYDQHFFDLADRYYNEDDSVRSDPRLDEANVWFWDETAQALSRVVVPQRVFNPVMAMRCCDEALRFRSDHHDAISLWLAANIRRESRLGLNVESSNPDEKGETDPTRPEIFPRALYFTQTAGARYAHRVLERGVADQDAQVALGAIEALRATAGESSLIGMEDLKQPLVQALRFPDLLVRIRASLALGAALPRSQFSDSQFVIPLLAMAIAQTGREQVVVVDPDDQNLNRVAGALRQTGREVIAEKSFFRAVDRSRSEFQQLSAVFVSTDIADPDLRTAIATFRSEFAFSKTPVIVLTKSRQSVQAEDVVNRHPYLASVNADVEATLLENAVVRLREHMSSSTIDAVTAGQIALSTVDVLHQIALDGRTIYDLSPAEPALIASLSATDDELQVRAVGVLALLPTPTSQRAIAHVGLDDTQSEPFRLAALEALAVSARRHGNLLEEDQTAVLIGLARDEQNLVLRTAASKALGTLNLANNRASEIIRGFYGG
ncbi:MAG: HEAT repeat domain-containing protein [Planctomycetota bacterium]